MLFDTMLDAQMLAVGHAEPQTGKIAIQKPWCTTQSAYLSHPAQASQKELDSLDLFTHESMHMRGELTEVRAECQAVQRNHRAAKLLGVPDATARSNALDTSLLIASAERPAACRVGTTPMSAGPAKPWMSTWWISTWAVR